MGTRCGRCGILKPHFATGWSAERTFEYTDSGLCIACRHRKRPGAQVRWQGDVKATLAFLNSRENRPGRKKGKEVRT